MGTRDPPLPSGLSQRYHQLPSAHVTRQRDEVLESNQPWFKSKLPHRPRILRPAFSF